MNLWECAELERVKTIFAAIFGVENLEHIENERNIGLIALINEYGKAGVNVMDSIQYAKIYGEKGLFIMQNFR